MSEHFYTIRDVQEITGIPATALRFYDKRGLLVFVKRSSSGIRIFTDSDVEKIRMIQFLRNIDMPVNVISRFIGLMLQGDSTRNERRRMVDAQLASLKEEAALLQEKIEAADSLKQSLSMVSNGKFSVSTPRNFWSTEKVCKIFSARKGVVARDSALGIRNAAGYDITCGFWYDPACLLAFYVTPQTLGLISYRFSLILPFIKTLKIPPLRSE